MNLNYLLHIHPKTELLLLSISLIPFSISDRPYFIISKYGTRQLVLKRHTFNRHVKRESITYWRCSQFAVLRCKARIKTNGTTLTVLNPEHNHEVISKSRSYGSLKKKTQMIKEENEQI